jgi:GT2 family glycosyltransferase
MNPYRFSVIIPTYNRPEQLTECLMAIRSQDFPKDSVEIIVVDDGSHVPVKERVGGKEELGDIRWIRIDNSGPAAARNRGSNVSRGDYLVFIDDDCIPSPDWLANVDRCATLYPDCLIGGRTLNRLLQNQHAATSQIIVDAVYRFYNADPASARFLATNNMTVRADLFASVGGFHEGFRIASEDREFCDRWLHQKRRIVFCEEIVIFHDHLLNFPSFCRQHFNYGRGAYQYHSLRHKRGSGRIRADMKFHVKLYSLLRASFIKLNRTMGVKVFIMLVVWQIMNLIGFLVQSSKPRN